MRSNVHKRAGIIEHWETAKMQAVFLLSLLSVYAVRFCTDGAVQSAMEGDLRLVHRNPDLQSCGRVEVFHNGSWGTVCDNSWHKRDADVACRQLGYTKGSRFRCHEACFGQGEGKIWLDSLSCPRDADRLMQCNYREWGEHDCSHEKDAGVCCKGKHTPQLLQTSDTRVCITCPCSADNCTTCSVRLGSEPGDCNSTTPAIEGMVEVSFGDAWIPVSTDAWSATAAHVACGELGYPRALGTTAVLPNDHCTVEERETLKRYSGVGSHVVKSVQCTGSESMLANCTLKTGLGSNNFCAVKLQCGFPDCPDFSRTHRLRSGAVPWRGRVEVKVNNTWGTVYDEHFELADANVACRATGFGSAIAVQNSSEYGRGIGPVHLRCRGNETLSDCDSTSGSDLDHSRDVGVQCRRPTLCTPLMSMVDSTTDSDDKTISGYVQFLGSEGPGLVCGGELDVLAARVYCASTNEMFLHDMTQVVPPSTTTDAMSIFYRGSIQCTGEEADITECSISMNTIAECPQGLVQHIMCTSCVPDLVPDLNDFRNSLTRYSSPAISFSPAITSIPMNYLTCAQEENCLSSVASNSGSRTLLRFDSTSNNWGRCPFLPNLDPDDWIFHDCHNHLHSFEAFVEFNLVHPETGEQVAEGHKASFCLEDTHCADGYTPYYRCLRTTTLQGISPNCGDKYRRFLDCQWIDITGVESGTYLLSQTLNPHRDTTESDFRNNKITCKVDINVDDRALTVIDCWQSDHI